MKKFLITLATLFAAAAVASASHTFITPASVTTTSVNDLWPVSNLIQGPGVGVDAADPHDRTAAGAGGLWVTDAPGGFPSDYIAVAGAPVLTFDLGADTAVSSIHTWGYATTNANGVKDFSLRFGTDAGGLGGIGSSVTFNPTYAMTIDNISMQSNSFGQNVTARYVELTALSTHITNGGNGPPAGGDRVGLGEVLLGIPEPSVSLLGMLALAGLGLRRRRK